MTCIYFKIENMVSYLEIFYSILFFIFGNILIQYVNMAEKKKIIYYINIRDGS